MINNSTASLNDVDDGQADESANIPKAIDSNEALEKQLQEGSELGNRDQRRQEPNLELKHSLIGKQNMPGFKKNSITEGTSNLRASTGMLKAEITKRQLPTKCKAKAWHTWWTGCYPNGVKVDSESSVNFSKCPLPTVRCPHFFKARGNLSHFGQFLE